MAKKMNPSVKNLWLKKLRIPEGRNGWYPQGRLRLVRDWENHDAFCCLGVLENEAIKARVPGASWDAADEEHDTEIPDLATMEWAGLTLRTCEDLAYMNDDEGLSFVEIAAWIEKNL